MTITVGGTAITFNDGTVQSTAPAAPTTAQVLSATAAASVGAVGTYAFLRSQTSADYNFGATLAGSNLRYAGVGMSAWYEYSSGGAAGGTGFYNSTNNVSGTWRCMGVIGYSSIGCTTYTSATLWLRIS